MKSSPRSNPPRAARRRAEKQSTGKSPQEESSFIKRLLGNTRSEIAMRIFLVLGALFLNPSDNPKVDVQKNAVPELVSPAHGTSVESMTSQPEPKPEPEKIRSSMKIGPWKLNFSEKMSLALETQLRGFLKQASPLIEELTGPPSTKNSGDWTVKLTDDGAGYTFENEKVFAIGEKATDAVKLHEFSHMFQGDDFPEINWIREGMAVAVSNLTAERMGILRWDLNLPSPLLGENFGLYLGQSPNALYDFKSMERRKVRYIFSGKFWEEVEKEKPGSIKRFTTAMRAKYRGKDKGDIEKELGVMTAKDLMREFLGEVPRCYERYRILFEPAIVGGEYKNMAYASFYSGRGLFGIAAVQRRKDTAESPGVNMSGTARFQIPGDNRILDVPFQTNKNGEALVSTEGLSEQLGKADVYQLTVLLPDTAPERLQFSLPN